MTDIPVWELGNCKWIQDNETRDMTLVACNGDSVVNYSDAQLGALRLALPMRRHTSNGKAACKCKYLPQEFSYCPFCGDALNGPGQSGPLWAPPYGAVDGTRVYAALDFADSVVTDSGAAAIGGVTEFPLPRHGANFNFVVARLGTPERVLACIDKSGGVIDIYDAISGAWVTLKRTGPNIDCSRQPDWSWSAAVSEGKTVAALCWPTPEGPLWSDINMMQGTTRTILGTGRCIGGAAQLGDQFLIPAEVDGTLVFQRFDPVRHLWLQIPMEELNVGTTDYLGVPIVDKLREKIYWVGADGFLTCTIRGAELLPSWRAWDERGTCVGLPMYGPPHIDRNNRFWQLCLYTERDSSYRYYELGGDVDDFHGDITGEMLSTGRTAFDLQHNYWNDPWDEASGDRFPRIRIPLLQLGDNNEVSTVVTMSIASDGLLISEMHDRATGFVDREAKNLEFHLISRESIARPFLLNQHVLSTKRPWECKAFIYQHGFYLYFPDKSKCYRWPMAHGAA
jgi:hypothetical protein